MSDILQNVITAIITFLTTGGIGSILYSKLNKKLKAAEVRAAEAEVESNEISNLSASNEEWIKLYNQCLEEKHNLEESCRQKDEKIAELYASKDTAWEKYSDSRMECSKKDLVINELNWYRCEIDGCPYRKPPRKYGDKEFPKDGLNPIEYPDPNVL